MAATEVLDLRDYMQSISRRRRWVVVSTVLGAVLALGMSLSQNATYNAKTEVLVLPATVPGVEVAPNSIISMPNELEIANSAAVSAKAAAALAAAGGQAQLGTIEVTNPTDTQTLDFEASAPDPASAQATAKAYADAYGQFRQDSLLSSVQTRLDSVTQALKTLNDDRAKLLTKLAGASNQAEIAAVQSQLDTANQEIAARQQEQNDLELAANAEVARVLEEPVAPTAPSSPRPLRDVIIGAMLGFVLGLVLALLRDRLDQRVRDRDDVVAVTGAPVIGMIPDTASLHRMVALLPGGDPSAAEAFRTLRTRVLFSAAKEGFRSIMVTSATPYESKTTTAANLAVALAQADNRVVIVSADLHRPGLWRYLPDRGKLGLADVLAGAASLSSVVVPTAQDNLLLLPSGTLAIVPEAALGSADMLAIIEQLKDQADLVILDSPPVLGVSDTLELASIVDAVLLTVDTTHAKKSSLRETVGELQSVGATILGVLLHRPEKAHFEGYNYRYGHREDAERVAELQDEASKAIPETAPPADVPAAATPIRDANGADRGRAPVVRTEGAPTSAERLAKARREASESASSGNASSRSAVDEHEVSEATSTPSSGRDVMMRGRLWPT